MNILFFDCFSGISGDMILGALLDLGLPFEYLQEQIRKLNIEGYRIEYHKAERHHISAIKFDVEVTESGKHRHLKDIKDIIFSAGLSPFVEKLSIRTFSILAKAEAKIHDSTPEKIHFHEVGGIDAIIDIVGTAIGIEYFKPDAIYSSPLTLGSGTAKSSHGVIPIPAPATMEILKGFPVIISGAEGERVTPTGAAVLVTLIEQYGGGFDCPELAALKIGYGAGSKKYDDCPNLLRIIMGEAVATDANQDFIEVVETNIDDMNPQIYDYLFSRLYSIGAAEVFITPVIMKKNRPGNILTVLCKKDLVDKICDVIFSETSTAGIRFRSDLRKILARKEKVVETDFGSIRVKILRLNNGYKIQPEYDDCNQAASRHNVPLIKVLDAAKRQAEIEEG